MKKFLTGLLRAVLVRAILNYRRTSASLIKIKGAKAYVRKVENLRQTTRTSLIAAIAGILYLVTLGIWVNMAIIGLIAYAWIDDLTEPVIILIKISCIGAALLVISAGTGILCATSNKLWIRLFKVNELLARVRK
ncbi:MAG TPA: hypothetical protein DIT01_11290 [Lentisphaeria bacterium]|nr:hypothetical protein [Lentisphaeria bacterium]|tara:strand:+ start:72 stop:476 length:405 start_codon:yes stop_codon:yes gene_type:complete